MEIKIKLFPIVVTIHIFTSTNMVYKFFCSFCKGEGEDCLANAHLKGCWSDTYT